ncbi:1,4-alpha-glucan branching protein GlgB [Youngiibacter multivorans]|uniref:1,4-alpha-glucan branching enzyme GlgB n=1 Tax=Youngiibacter multivorans TaxID=937251 RepID=A0ABS4G4V4_9CLOT|nr:1,4-alpha-glucan branching protein GlgB [Youngiibacter multivorans]MBP1919568.1 1,4-alpha-glucan branching enzyme [Youngiibacter multivorans]
MAAGTDSMEKSMNTEFNHFLFNSGEHLRSYEFMGAHMLTIDGVNGVQFTVWAPNARIVHLSGDFNSWGKTEMKPFGAAGIWSVFLPGIHEGTAYKYIVVTQDGRELYKSDPYAFWSEVRPKTSSVIKDLNGFEWTDDEWYMTKRSNPIHRSPVNIYELHAGSWKRHWDGRYFTYSELSSDLIPYVKEMGYTHIELMPLMEHPLDDSWGYQITGYFSATSRYGEPKELMAFVDKCHEMGIGVIMDWVPAHFCRDAHGLYLFDGTPTYEYQDPNKANNNRWGTTHFDFGKSQVQSFLISNAIFWLEMYHIDGLRVDAVSSMLYLDYDDGPWTPNIYGGNTNLEAVDFLKKLNRKVFQEYPEALMIAEESTAFPKITHPIQDGGLGFTFKWDMGWMNDTLKYFSLDPMYRKYHHNLITFSYMYIFSENFMLALSHDEVVHGKGSLLNKMTGDDCMKFAGLRTLMAYMMCHPGKKLNFMGSEIAQWLEWRFREGLEWVALQHESHQKHIEFVKVLNHLYLERKCLHEIDDSYDGIDILDADNKDHSLFTFIRYAKDRKDFLVVACNFTPVQRDDVRIGVPFEGEYAELLNTELEKHGGTWKFSKDEYTTEKIPQDKKQYSIQVILPPLSVLIIEPKKIKEVTI